MPSYPITRPVRPSAVGGAAVNHTWSKKRPASPQAAMHAGSSRPKTVVHAAPVPAPRRAEPVYFEEDYREEILAYMSSMDNATLASADLMDMQPEVQWQMRPYLIDFLIEVHSQFRLRPEVLYLAMNIADRYVSKRVVYKKHYQLVGCAALWIAAKFEDGKDKVPLVRELAEMCCKTYDESAVIQMEGHVLSTIQWTIGHPTAEAWLRVYTIDEHGEDLKVSNVARFLMEITLFHREFVGIQSAFVAAGALMLAQFICGRPRTVVSKYENIAVRIATAIDRRVERLENLSEFVVRKYAPTYYSRASTVVREWYLSGRRYSYVPESPITPMSAALTTPSLAPSGSWPAGKRGSWMSASPSTGSISCSSSDAGDDAPLTPVTPMSQHEGGYPFATVVSSSASKENIAPMHHGHGHGHHHGMYANGSSSSTDLLSHAAAQQPKAHHQHQHVALPTHYAQRTVLHPIPAVDALAIPAHRAIRRSSS